MWSQSRLLQTRKVLLCAILIAFTFAAGTANNERIAAVWSTPNCLPLQATQDELVSFTLYLPMNEALSKLSDPELLGLLHHKLGPQAHVQSERDKLHVLHEMMAAHETHTMAVLDWLQHGNCRSATRNTIRCDGISVAHMNSVVLKSDALCRYMSKHQDARIIPTARFGLMPSQWAQVLSVSGMDSHVRHVEGLLLFDHTMRPTRHQQAKHMKPTQEQSASGFGSSTSLLVPEWPMVGRPVVLNVNKFAGDSDYSVLVAPVCSDGTTPQNGDLCDTNPIALFSVQMSIAGGPISLTNIPADNAICNTAFTSVVPVDLSYFDYTTCNLYLPYNLTGYETLTLFASVTYADGTGSLPSHLCPWNDQMYYGGSCATESTATYANRHENWVEDIRTKYQIPSEVDGSPDAVIGIMEWTDGSDVDVFIAADVADYMQYNNLTYNLEQQLNLTYYTVGTTQLETTLDVELVAGLVPGATTYLFSMVSTFTVSPLGAWLSMLEDVLTDPASYPATVYSVSWTFGDPMLNFNLAQEITARFRLLSLAGITVVSASGDSGASFQGYNEPLLAFPNSSPYCISVGATAFRELYSHWGGVTEVVCSAADSNIITSGGGYSSMYELPPYQKSYVQGAMRGGPDVAALGANIGIVANGDVSIVYGTSAATPIVASIIALFNAVRRTSTSASSIPLLHYYFYNSTVNGNFFQDIAIGNNCATESNSFIWMEFGWYGEGGCYTAGTGWDAVTGLGTPNFPALARSAETWVAPTSAPSADAVSNTPSSSDGWIPGVSTGVGYVIVGGSALVVVSLVVSLVIHRRNKNNVSQGGQVAMNRYATI